MEHEVKLDGTGMSMVICGLLKNFEKRREILCSKLFGVEAVTLEIMKRRLDGDYNKHCTMMQVEI